MAELFEAARVQAREAEGAMAASGHQPLPQPADFARDAAQVLGPVLTRPDLPPVDHQREPAEPARREDGQQRKVEPRRLDDVVVRALPRQVPEDAEAEPKLHEDAATTLHVELHRRGDGDDLHAGHLCAHRGVPLQPRQVGHLVPAVGEAFRERAVPALTAADGVRVQAVENEANAHRRRTEGLQTAKKPEEAPSRIGLL